MMASLDKLIRFIGIVLVPLGVALFIKEYYFLELGAKQAVVSTVAALIGMIPEGLYLADQRGPGGERRTSGPG